MQCEFLSLKGEYQNVVDHSTKNYRGLKEVFKHIWNTSTKLKLSHPQTVLAPSIFKLDSHNSCLRITGK
jgi:hypothetical protein